MRNGLKWVAAFAAAVIIEGTGAGSVQASGAEWEEWTGSNGVQYAGYRKDGVIHGMGEAVYADQSKYTGTFTDGRREGTGECEWPSGDRFQGEYSQGKRNGLGIYISTADADDYGQQSGMGTRYEGEYVNDRRDGLGYYRWADGTYYIGEWTDGEWNGLGIVFYADGGRQAGVWQDGELQPEGQKEEWTDAAGNLFIGDRSGDTINGKGIAIYKSGRCYVGDFAGGQIDGRGIFSGNTGTDISVIFRMENAMEKVCAYGTFMNNMRLIWGVQGRSTFRNRYFVPAQRRPI